MFFRISLATCFLFSFCCTSPCPAQPQPAATPPGIVIDHISAETRQYIGSPSLAVLADGTYVASHDLFGPGSTKDRTLVFHSTDRGVTWTRLTEITGQWWSTLFVHQSKLYLMGTSREYGFSVIRRSDDGGTTWTDPSDKSSGLLLEDGKYHCAPVPVVVHQGRIWRAMEDAQGPGGWGRHFRAFMMSAPIDADLLKAENWTSSNRLGGDPTWLENRFGGWLEGNAVVTPEGTIADFLRVDDPKYPERYARVDISADGRTATFDPTKGFLEFPGGAKKFTIRFDPKSKLYWSLSNDVPEPDRTRKPAATRNTLTLVSSPDLAHWTVRKTLLHHPDLDRHAFQYVDWLFEGDDIIAVTRTAFDDETGGAHNAHDANNILFHRFKDFRAAQ